MRLAAAGALGAAGALLLAGPAPAQVDRRSTLEVRIQALGDAGFRLLGTAPGERWTIREELGTGRPARERRRRSLLYFSQLTDFQLADEESPARVELLDREGDPLKSAWRPQEALGAQTVDAAIRQVNAFADRSPVAQEAGRRARMAFALVTGDNVDNHQLNETRWEVQLLEGGSLTPNSGASDPRPVYTGVQDRDDMPVPDPYYYDPDAPADAWAEWPRYPGLMDRAQEAFQAAGLKVPAYVAFGNHDTSTQGTQWTNATIEAIALGDVKVFGEGLVGPVPSDPERQFVDKAQYKRLHATAAAPDAHGFGRVDRAEQEASRGAAGYYAWHPGPGLRFISVDTVCEGTSVARPGPSDGNVDHAQFLWLERQLKDATARDELVVLFSHHAIPSLVCDVPDEETGPCLTNDSHGHGVNPGCDLDPRPSTPLHLADDVKQLVLRYPHVISWIAGHTHANKVEPFKGTDGRGFWSIRLASEIDWPQQSRLLELLDNRDGTLSIFGTILDHGAPLDIPASGATAAAFTPTQLASISRTLAANDPHEGAPRHGVARKEGLPKDRNVELVVPDPRRSAPGRCADPVGRIAGTRVGSVALRRTRAAVRGAFASRVTRRGVDSFCLTDGGTLRVRYAGRRSALVLTSSPAYRAAGVRPGERASRLRGRARALGRLGASTWFVAPARRGARGVFRVRDGRVREVGLADARHARTARSARRLLRGLGAG